MRVSMNNSKNWVFASGQVCIVSVTFGFKANSRKCYLAEIVDEASFVDKVETGGCSEAGGVVMIAVDRKHGKPGFLTRS